VALDLTTRSCLRSLHLQEDAAGGRGGMLEGGQLFVAGGNRTVLLEAIDEPPDSVALTIGRSVEAAISSLVYLARDHRPDPTPPQRAAVRTAAGPLVARQPGRPPVRSLAPRPLDRPAIEQRRQGRLLVALACRQRALERLPSVPCAAVRSSRRGRPRLQWLEGRSDGGQAAAVTFRELVDGTEGVLRRGSCSRVPSVLSFGLSSRSPATQRQGRPSVGFTIEVA
jgi:hypothetical protein